MLIASQSLFSQVLTPGEGPRAWKKDNVQDRQSAIELTHIREADVMWSTRIWEEIDLRQKSNLPLYYPLDENLHGKRSLIQVIFDLYINKSNVNNPNGVKIYEDWQFEKVLTWEEIKSIVIQSQEVIFVDVLTCEKINKIDSPDWRNQIKPNIIKIRLMKDVFFDKQRSVYDERILGFALVIPTYETSITDQTCQNGITEKGFTGFNLLGSEFDSEIWFFFPQLRDDLALIECYKRQNDAARLSYDDIFLQRIFTSYIYREENVYDRQISDYTNGLNALLEAERIKNKIFDFEQDLWHY